MARSARRVALDICSTTARGIGRTMQRLRPDPLSRVGARLSMGLDYRRPIKVRDRDKREKTDLPDAHGRRLVVVGYGRAGSVVNAIAAECEVGHTRADKARIISAAQIYAAAKRRVRAFLARLVADEAENRGIGYFLR